MIFMLASGLYITHPLNLVKENTTSRKKYFQINITKIYVSIFVNYLQFWGLRYIWKIWPTLYVRISNIQFKSNIIKISYGYFIHQINIHRCRGNSQHSMLARTDFNDISNYPY